MEVGIWLNLLSGAFLALLGVGVLAIRPRRPANVAFAVFAVAYGLRPIPANLAMKLGLLRDINMWLSAALALVAAAAMLAVAWGFPRRVAASERGRVMVPALAALAFLVFAEFAFVDVVRTGIFVDSTAVVFQTAVFILLTSATVFPLLFLPLRFRAAPAEDATARRQYALVAAAFTSYFAFTATAGWSEDASVFTYLSSGLNVWVVVKLAEVGVVLLASVLWIRNTGGAGSVAARNAALYGPALLLAGLLYAVAGFQDGGHGVARFATVVILGVAILRFQLLDTDVKLRWSVKSGTIAGAFIGVFFIASEAAQEFFSDATGSAFIGIAIAGLLVFAISPLQRAADRIANAAIPTPFEGAKGAVDAKEAYRNQVRIAWRDGTLNAKEMLMLRELRGYLRLPAEEADRIEAEVAASAART